MKRSEYQNNFISKASIIHNRKYDYSLVEYIDAHRKVKIICPIHGLFEQNPNNHLNGQGCPSCKKFNNRKLKYGVGVFDWHKHIGRNDKEYKSYKKWSAILERVYSEKLHIKHSSYKNCSLCKEWHLYSNFKKWFDENYIEVYSLDKDILVKGNKMYSPEKCCFVPSSINTLIIKNDAKRGQYPIGVCLHNGVSYIAQMTLNGKHITIGIYHTPLEAFEAYKKVKEGYIKEIAEKYFSEGKIAQRVYEALMNYEISITD